MSGKVFLKLLNTLPHFEVIKVVRVQRERIGNEKVAVGTSLVVQWLTLCFQCRLPKFGQI